MATNASKVTTVAKRRVKTHLRLRSFRRVLKIIKDNEKYVQEHPDAKPLFNYAVWIVGTRGKTPAQIVQHPCGTQCCIGGWGNVLDAADKKAKLAKNQCGTYNEIVAAEFYGMTYVENPDWLGELSHSLHIPAKKNEAQYLFYGDWHHAATNAPTSDVIAKLENIIKTGKVVNPRFDKKYLVAPAAQGE